ncbi:MAG TPA: TIGR03620 family F420-dependent LLM class oxidoreductase [Jatrophihabitans sp.]|nr:TIGR03620 family F420-dependent LLM class oxidoreductase [Jatrophihabitans sp.]
MQLGSYGAFVTPPRLATEELAAGVEEAGYGTLWVGGNPGGDLGLLERALRATIRLVLATGIINIWKDDAADIAAAWRRIEEATPGRLLLGIGVGHHETDGARYAKPYQALLDYLDELEAGGVPRTATVIGALGPRVLAMSAERSHGAHPYLTTPRHTRQAREILGTEALLAPEHKVVLTEDAEVARALGRDSVVHPYLSLANYANSLRRQGYTDDDLAGEGSDRLIDDLVAYGPSERIVARLREHLEAGADHLAVQVLVPRGTDPLDGFRRLAPLLGL